MELLYREGEAPQQLVVIHDLDGNAFTPPFADNDLTALGFKVAPPKPDDTETQTVEWDIEAEEWVMVDRPPPPPPVVEPLGSISDRQFFQALSLPPYSLISRQEALDAVKTGEIPPVMEAIIDQLPEDAQYDATMKIAGGTVFNRDDPLVEVFGSSQGMDAAAVDDFWRFAQGLV